MSDSTLGRPKGRVQRERPSQVLALLAGGSTIEEALAETRMHPRTFVRLCDKSEYLAAVAALLDGRAQSVAVIVGHDQALEAA